MHASAIRLSRILFFFSSFQGAIPADTVRSSDDQRIIDAADPNALHLSNTTGDSAARFAIYLLRLFISTRVGISVHTVHARFIRSAVVDDRAPVRSVLSLFFPRPPLPSTLAPNLAYPRVSRSASFRVILAIYAYARASTTQLYLFVCNTGCKCAHGKRANTYVDIPTRPRLVNCKITLVGGPFCKTVSVSEKSSR